MLVLFVYVITFMYFVKIQPVKICIVMCIYTKSSLLSMPNSRLTHFGLMLHTFVITKGSHFPSDANMLRKFQTSFMRWGTSHTSLLFGLQHSEKNT